MAEELIETEYALHWIEEGILNAVYKPNLVLTESIAKKLVEDRLKISKGITMPIFVDLREIISADTKARKYMAGEEAVRFISAGAFQVNGLISKLAGNIFIAVDKPLVPTKLFTDRDKAIGWLEKFK